jgi:hypothetical protein
MSSASDAAARPRSLPFPFLPRALQRPQVLSWLRRMHAWIGVWGAVLFLFLGVSGVLLNHRSILKIDTGGAQEVDRVETVLEAPLADEQALVGWFRERWGVEREPLSVKRTVAEGAVALAGVEARPAETWTVRFRGPNAVLEGTYRPEARLLTVTRTEQNFLGLLKELHKGHGVTVFWVLLVDAIAGALFFQSLTGILLWSRLHGGRLAAAGLVLGAAALGVGAAIPTLL